MNAAPERWARVRTPPPARPQVSISRWARVSGPRPWHDRRSHLAWGAGLRTPPLARPQVSFRAGRGSPDPAPARRPRLISRRQESPDPAPGTTAGLISRWARVSGPAPGTTAGLIDQLNRDFGILREVLTGAEAALAESLLEPVLARFTETLDAVAADRPDLDPKCGALSAKLKNFLEPPNSNLPESFPDDGVPF